MDLKFRPRRLLEPEECGLPLSAAVRRPFPRAHRRGSGQSSPHPIAVERVVKLITSPFLKCASNPPSPVTPLNPTWVSTQRPAHPPSGGLSIRQPSFAASLVVAEGEVMLVGE